MNVIIAYLDTMFSPYPQNPRMLEAKAELQAMMEDAYQAMIAKGVSHNEAVGKVITDFGNLDELAPVLGITGEIRPVAPDFATDPHDPAAASVSGAASSAPAKPAAPQHPPVTLEEAEGFAEAHRRTRYRLSTAIVLFVLAAIPIIMLPVAAQEGLLPLEQNAAAIVGLLLLFVLVAVGVVMIIGLSREFAPFKRLQEGQFSRNPVVSSWADDLAQQHDRSRILGLQLAVLCWVLSPAPLLLLTLVPQNSPMQGFWSVLGVALLLIMVALGLLILLPRTWANTVSDTLNRGGRGAPTGEEEERSIVGVIASFYWPLLTVVYLGWSFIGDAWGTSWIVWPIGAVLFGAIAAGSGAVESYRRARR